MTYEGLHYIQTGKVVSLRMTGLNEAIKKLERLKEKGTILKPILEDTLTQFKLNMRSDFDARVSPDSVPVRWQKLSPKYAKAKFKAIGKRMANLVYSGRLKAAVSGGVGWYQNVTNTQAEFGIAGIPYAAAHQYGYTPRKLPARPYFLAAGNKLPGVIINYLIGRIEKEIIEAGA